MDVVIDKDTVWKSGLEINIENLKIISGATLTIESGVQINLGGRIEITPGTKLDVEGGAAINGDGEYSGIDVYGSLIADGTTTNKINFGEIDIRFPLANRGSPNTQDVAAQFVALDHVEIIRGGIYADGRWDSGEFKITNSIFYDGSFLGFPDPTKNSLIVGNIFVKTGLVTYTKTASLTIENNLFVDWGWAAVRSFLNENDGTIVKKNSFIAGTDSAYALVAQGYPTASMTASENYFGTTDPFIVEKLIFDRADWIELTRINPSFTTMPDPQTPTPEDLPAPEVQTYALDVLVDRGILAGYPILLKGLTETTTERNGVLLSHTVEYNGTIFNYSDVDPLITTVVKDGAFTAEFQNEIKDFAVQYAKITYDQAVALVGVQAIDLVIVNVAGSDGNYVL